MSYFKGKVIWITGASSGIGEALCLTLDQSNIRLVLSSRNMNGLESVSKKITRAETFCLPLDLSDSSNFDQLRDQIIDKYGKIDILINNGGVSQRSEVWETSESVERQIMETNYFGNIALAKSVLAQFRERQEGHLVIMSSIAGKFGFFQRSSYSASKHALHGYYESLRLEEEHNNIVVSLICPGKINTPISKNALKGDGSKHESIDNNQKNGMSAEKCAQLIIKGVAQKKKEVLVGGSEIKGVWMKRFFPNLFHKILRKKSAT